MIIWYTYVDRIVSVFDQNRKQLLKYYYVRRKDCFHFHFQNRKQLSIVSTFISKTGNNCHNTITYVSVHANPYLLCLLNTCISFTNYVLIIQLMQLWCFIDVVKIKML